VLVVFNHPLWDLYLIGQEKHEFLVGEFCRKRHIPARAGAERAAQLGRKPRGAAAGGEVTHAADLRRRPARRGPNANINLTNATSFSEFVQEIRRQKKSDMLFMPQYAEPWKHRILQSTVDAIRHYPEFPQGSRPGTSAFIIRIRRRDPPLSELWPMARRRGE